MKKGIIITMVVLLTAYSAQALTTNELAGNWNVAITATNHVPVFGNVCWRSIAFASNVVTWSWVRDGVNETHSGTFRIVAEELAKAGMFQAYRIEINPTTLAVPAPMVLKAVVLDMDNRFPPGTVVLRIQDAGGNRHVFRKKED